MAVLARKPLGTTPRIGSEEPLFHLAWFAGVSVVAFLIPFVLSSHLDINHDLYYLAYFAGTLLALAAYAQASGVDVGEQVRRRWRLSLAVGAITTAFVVWSVLARVDPTPHPTGLYFVFEIVWRGAIYGIVDALLLSAFPGLVAFALMRHDISGPGRRVAYAALTLALVLVITGVYHLGYEDLQNEDIAQPELGNTIISLPVALSANPIGSVIAHTSMHLAAVTHAYESKDRLPPQIFVDKGPEGGTPAPGVGPNEAASQIRATVTGARPLLILNAVPDEWRADVTTRSDSFRVVYTSPDGSKKVTIEIAAANPPLPGPSTRQTQPGFHGDARSLYQVQDSGDPLSRRFLLWVEPGTWTTTTSLGGVPYYLVTEGMTEDEFWQMANSLHPSQI